jgi:hypothetical protein
MVAPMRGKRRVKDAPKPSNAGGAPADSASKSTAQTPRQIEAFERTKLCKFHIVGRCLRGSECKYAHDVAQLQALPNLFCTKLCKKLLNSGTCDDADCRYAHNRDELRAMPRTEGQSPTELSPASIASHRKSLSTASTCSGSDLLREPLKVPLSPSLSSLSLCTPCTTSNDTLDAELQAWEQQAALEVAMSMAQDPSMQYLESMWYAGMDMGSGMPYSNYSGWQIDDGESCYDNGAWGWTADTGYDYNQAHELAEDLLRAVDDEDALACLKETEASSYTKSAFKTEEAIGFREMLTKKTSPNDYYWHSL